jgi:formyltetrahydrofolate deformylase
MDHAPGTGILLLSCPDRRGLVASVSDFLFSHGANILHADQHTDQEEGTFLQRVEFELAGMDISPDEIGAGFAPVAERFGMRWIYRQSAERPRMAVLVSREPHCLWDLLVRWRMGELRGDMAIVVSNHPDHSDAAASFGIPFHHLPVDAENRHRQEHEMLSLMEVHEVELVVLARYMQLLSATVVDRFPNRIINIHHSFLPAFAGGRPYHKAYERGVKVIGATAHYVTEALDQGPIIDQDVVRVSHRDTVGDLVEKGRDLEKVVLARAVRLHLDHRVLVYKNKTVVFD